MADQTLGELELQLEFEGRTYRLRPGDFTGEDDLAVFKEIGVSIADIFLGRISLFTIAALIWRYRVNNGEPKLGYREVNNKMSFAVLETISDEPEGLAPEA